MKRLTEKFDEGYMSNVDKQECVEKCGRYEDIDERLNIPYPDLVKMLETNVCYMLFAYDNHILKMKIDEIDVKRQSVDCSHKDKIGAIFYTVHFWSYGTKWSANKEDLE